MRLLRHCRAGVLLAMSLSTPALAEDIVILTGGTSGVYYPLGLALQKIFARDLPNSKVSVISTQATVENLNLLQQGKGQLALAQGDILTDAWKGNPEAGFQAPEPRFVWSAPPIPTTFISSRDVTPISDRCRIWQASVSP
jgi:uncharacterized protein